MSKIVLFLSLATNLALLGYFKYAGFFVDSFISMFESLNIQTDLRTLSIILPVGISFYTFQSMSYSIDVYRKDTKPTKDYVAFLAYVSFFPQLVAGPIERASRLLPQFLAPTSFSKESFRFGLRQILVGFFKKLVLADNIAPFVNIVYSDVGGASPTVFTIATVGFALQIYFDFSAYSHIARGTASILGFNLMRNFASPYGALSLTDFWRRWHISLSTWFRDYMYIPLGGNRKGEARSYVNTLVVFVVSGLWHGANWTFVVWGAIHGLFLCVERLGLKSKAIFYNRKEAQHVASPHFISTFVSGVTRYLITMFVVMYAWVYFRADNISEAYTGSKIFLNVFTAGFDISKLTGSPWIVTGVLICGIEALWQKTARDFDTIHFIPRWILYMALAVAIFALGSRQESDFVYFQF